MTTPIASRRGEASALDDTLERWQPVRRHVRAPWRWIEFAPLLGVAAVFLLFGGITRSTCAVLTLLIVFAGWFVHAFMRPTRARLADSVHFELTPHRVRVRMRASQRALRLDQIARIDVLPVSRRASVGHVVIRSLDEPEDAPPAIPTGRRVGGGSAGLVVWANVEYVQPEQQLFEGVLTFWYVAHPEEVRRRIEAAMVGVTPHARGPHR